MILCQHTMPVALFEFLSQPQNRLGAHLCAKVSVERRWSATLETIEDGHVYQQLHCNVEKQGEILFILSFFKYLITWTNLLHVSENVLTTVENPFALLWVQVEDEVSGVVGVTVLIPIVEQTDDRSLYSYLERLKLINSLSKPKLFLLLHVKIST